MLLFFFKKKYTLVAEGKLVVLKIYVGIFYQISEQSGTIYENRGNYTNFCKEQ